MPTQTAELSDNINKFYDAAMFTPRLIAYYGGSDYTNFGYWTAETQNARQACDELMARLLGFIPEKRGRILAVAGGKGETTRYLTRHYAADQISAINISEKQIERGRDLGRHAAVEAIEDRSELPHGDTGDALIANDVGLGHG